MAINQIKPFATSPGANIVSQNEWETLPALLSGFTAGKASSAQINKALRQTSFIAAALAEFVSEKSGDDVLDDGDVAGFVAKLSSGLAADYLKRANPFAEIKAAGAAAVSTALANLGIRELIIGQGQNWNVSGAGRQTGVTYTNSTGKPIMISVSLIVNSGDPTATLYLNSAAAASMACSGFAAGPSIRGQLSAIIPVGGTYMISSGTIMQWSELR